VRLYLVQVETASLNNLKFGDRVVKGQILGMDLNGEVDALAPADGVIRHLGLEQNGRATIIHILSQED